VFMHVAAANYGVPSFWGVAPPAGYDFRTYEGSLTKKADIQNALRELIDPVTDQNYVEEKAVKNLKIEGDRVYLETAAPVAVNGRTVIPAGSYVTGTIQRARPAGRVKGRGELLVRFDSLTLPNGVSRDLRSRIGAGDETTGDVDRNEGSIKGESGRGQDARTVGETTAAGASIGVLAGAASGHTGLGAGIGAAAGAAAGLGRVLGGRGPQAQLARGATVEMVLDRNLTFTSAELARR